MNNTIRTPLLSALLGMVVLTTMPALAADAPLMQWPQLLPDGRGQRGAKVLRQAYIEASAFQVIPSEKTDSGAASWSVTPEDGRGLIRSRGGKQGGYHWVSAREEHQDELRIANTVVYFSNPGPAPRDMLEGSKAELEISPLRLPREHASYRAGETWPFEVRLEGKPLAHTSVNLATSQGTQQQLMTDDKGRIELVIPDDFTHQDHAAGGGHGDQMKARFLLGTQLEKDGKRLVSAFNYDYAPGPFADKSLLLGGITLFLGMGTAGALFLRKRPAQRSAS